MIGLVTCPRNPRLTDDDRPLIGELGVLGASATPVIWSDPEVPVARLRRAGPALMLGLSPAAGRVSPLVARATHVPPVDSRGARSIGEPQVAPIGLRSTRPTAVPAIVTARCEAAEIAYATETGL